MTVALAPPARARARTRRPAPRPSFAPPTAGDIERRAGRPVRRLFSLHVLLLLLVAVVAGRLVQVQVTGTERFVAFGEAQRITTTEIPASRGTITDRNGDILALSVDRPSVFADPLLVGGPDAAARAAAALAPVLGTDADTLARQMSGEGRFVYLSRHVDDATAAAVAELDLPGVSTLLEPQRMRPSGDELARSLVGTVSPWHEANSGIESVYDTALTGLPGVIVSERSATEAGRVVIPAGTVEVSAATPGQTVVLSIDRETQWLAERLLTEQVDATGADGGFAIVMHTRTGELLAVANVDAGATGGTGGEVVGAAPSVRNRAYVDSYEPGSVTKTFTIAAAIEEGVVGPRQILDVPPSYWFSDKEFIEPYRSGSGALSVTDILEHSSNIGTIKIAEGLGADRLHGYLSDFGFGSTTGVDAAPGFPGEQPGVLRDVEDWWGTTMATIAFGQGVTVTGVQLAAAYNTIANGGEYVAPTLVRGTADDDGRLQPVPRPVTRRVLSEDTAADMRTMLEEVVHGEGTGTRAEVPGYRVAGKTGTAQKAIDGRYSETAFMSTFAGFVPAENPELTIVVVLDEPRTEHLAGLVAAPLYRELARHTLQALRIPPSAAT